MRRSRRGGPSGGDCSGGEGVRRGLWVKIGGMAGVTAGAAMYAAGGADLLLSPEVARWPGPVVLASSSDYLVQALLVLGLAGTLGAVAGVLDASLRRSAHGRGRGWGLAVGSSSALLGHALLLYGALTTAARGAAAVPDPLAWGSPAALVGVVVLGTAALDAEVLPRWCGLLLVLGYPLCALPWGSWAGEWMIMGSVWAAVGYALLSGGGVPTRSVRPPRVRDRSERRRRPYARRDLARPRGGGGDRPRRRARRA